MTGGSEGYMLLNSNYGVCYKTINHNFKITNLFVFVKKNQKSNMRKAVESVSYYLELS